MMSQTVHLHAHWVQGHVTALLARHELVHESLVTPYSGVDLCMQLRLCHAHGLPLLSTVKIKSMLHM